MRHYRPAPLALLLAPAALAQTPLPLKHSPQRTVPAITAGDLMTRLYILADDSLEGREAGTIGNFKGTEYIAREAKRMGLVPAGDSGTYFQTTPLKTRRFDDYVPLTRERLDNHAVPIVYGGEARDTTHLIAAEQASGKLVVLAVAGGFGGLRALRAAPRIKGAVAVALVGLDSLPPPFLGFFRRPQSFLDDAPAGGERPTPVLLIGHVAAAKMFSTPLEQLTVGAAGSTCSKLSSTNRSRRSRT